MGLSKPELLIVDELGYLPLEPDAAHLFLQLVSQRYETGAMLITLNRWVAESGAVFADPVVATAILDRLRATFIADNSGAPVGMLCARLEPGRALARGHARHFQRTATIMTTKDFEDGDVVIHVAQRHAVSPQRRMATRDSRTCA